MRPQSVPCHLVAWFAKEGMLSGWPLTGVLLVPGWIVVCPAVCPGTSSSGPCPSVFSEMSPPISNNWIISGDKIVRVFLVMKVVYRNVVLF